MKICIDRREMEPCLCKDVCKKRCSWVERERDVVKERDMCRKEMQLCVVCGESSCVGELCERSAAM